MSSSPRHGRWCWQRVLVLLLALPCVPAAWAGGFTPTDAIREAALAALGTAAGSAETTIDPALRMAACTVPLQAVATSTRTVQVRCEDQPGWKLYVPVRIRQERDVVVLRDGVRAGETIGPEHLQVQRRDMAGAGGPGFDAVADLVGQTPRRDLAPGTPLVRDDLSEGRLLRRGDPVVLVSRAGGVEVRVAGRVLGQPTRGGTVSVENVESRRVVRGRVAGDGVVEVAR